MGTAHGAAGNDPVGLDDLVLDDEVQIGKRSTQDGDPVLQDRQAGALRRCRPVVDVVVRDELVDDRQVTLGEHLLDETAGLALHLLW
jgi:hypothetical protein